MADERSWGFLLLDKPLGLTSHTAVNRAARLLGHKKAGHAGTLDPMATGLMLVGLGRATRLLEHLVGCDKTYRAVIRLGMETTTLDREGEVTSEVETAPFPLESLEAALKPWLGEIEQIPPRHSAIKIDGVPLHRRARRGEEISVPPRRVTITRLEIVDYRHPDLTLMVDCSSGTYIRSLARDVGAALGVGGTLWELRRTRCGPFHVEDAATFDALSSPEAATRWVKSPEPMAYALPRLTLDAASLNILCHGRPLAVDAPDAADIAVFDGEGAISALAEVADGVLSPKKVFSA